MPSCTKKPWPRRGDTHHNSKLNSQAVFEIRRLYKKRGAFRLKDFAKKYGVCERTIWNVVHGVYWNDSLAHG
jgi:hypothetical protein